MTGATGRVGCSCAIFFPIGDFRPRRAAGSYQRHPVPQFFSSTKVDMMTTSPETPTFLPAARKSVPGYEDPAWDYGNPFGHVVLSPVRLATGGYAYSTAKNADEETAS